MFCMQYVQDVLMICCFFLFLYVMPRVVFALFAHLSSFSSRTFCTQFYVQFYLERDSTWLYLVREREVLE